MTQTAEDLTAGLEVLEAIVPLEVVTRQGTFSVAPIKMSKFKRFASLAWPLVEELMGLLDGAGDSAMLIEKHEPALVELLELSSDMTRAHYEEMYPDEFLKMVLAVVEVNMDFFVQNLIPVLGSRAGAIKDRLDKTLAKAGLTVSSASAATATQSKKSKTVH